MPYDPRGPCKTLKRPNFSAHQNAALALPKTHLLVQDLVASMDPEVGWSHWIYLHVFFFPFPPKFIWNSLGVFFLALDDCWLSTVRLCCPPSESAVFVFLKRKKSKPHLQQPLLRACTGPQACHLQMAVPRPPNPWPRRKTTLPTRAATSRSF